MRLKLITHFRPTLNFKAVWLKPVIMFYFLTQCLSIGLLKNHGNDGFSHIKW